MRERERDKSVERERERESTQGELMEHRICRELKRRHLSGVVQKRKNSRRGEKKLSSAV